jgi:hypothetical protein
MPVWEVSGAPATFHRPGVGVEVPYTIFRPDTPPVNVKGKTRKYVNPARTPTRLDVHPRSAALVRAPSIFLWIVEGIKKGDSLVTHGAAVVALLGVQNWHGADWRDIPLKGRDVGIVFDSDLMVKPEVQKALTVLTRYLTATKGAQVQHVYLPGDPSRKVGVDDFLLTHTIHDLEALLEDPRRVSRGLQQASSAADPRPVIHVTTDMVEVVDAIEDVLVKASGPPRLYQWNRQLSVVGRDEHPPTWLRDGVGQAVILQLSEDHCREEASRVAAFVRFDERKEEDVPCLPPTWAIRALLARSTWRVPHLSGVLTAPTIDPHGRIIDQPGYDPPTGLYLDFPARLFPPAPASVTRADALAALEILKKPFKEFRFVADCHKSTAIGEVFTLLARDLVAGNVPAVGVTATTPGSGKGLLIDTISIIGTGMIAPKWSNITDDVGPRVANGRK